MNAITDIRRDNPADTTKMYYALHLSDGTVFSDWEIKSQKDLREAVKTVCEDEMFSDRQAVAAFETENGGGSPANSIDLLEHILRVMATEWIDKNHLDICAETSNFGDYMSEVESRSNRQFNDILASEIRSIAFAECDWEAA